MGIYQGRALRAEKRSPRRRRIEPRRLIRVLVVLLALLALIHLPWDALRKSVGVVSRVEVRGVQYLDPALVQTEASVETSAPFRDTVPHHWNVDPALSAHRSRHSISPYSG